MRFKPVFIACLAVLALAGCSDEMKVDRAARFPDVLGFASSKPVSEEIVLTQQAEAFRDITADLKKRSTIKGAAVGALSGCGFSLVAGAGKGSCLQAAAKGAAIGGAMGFASGAREEKKLVQMIPLNQTLPLVKRAGTTAGTLARDMQAILVSQEVELGLLRSDLAAGKIPQAHYDTRVAEIRTLRAGMAKALSKAAENVAATRRSFEGAQEQGQDGLAWYLHALGLIEQDTISARDDISLL